ncbi:MAG: flagellar export chaperone FlgN [candidate division Zixibacteria bacterium]|nr:flagellar export chaperone FlgN [candidate division Zixibacteria bacterium]
MRINEITELERELLSALKEEYSFYQSLYILIDRQRDIIKFEKDEKLLDLFTEIERCHVRLKQSEEKIVFMREKNTKLFPLAATAPEVRKVVTSIITLIRKNMNIVKENEEYLRERHDRVRSELDSLQNSSKIMKYLRETPQTAQFVDSKN